MINKNEVLIYSQSKQLPKITIPPFQKIQVVKDFTQIYKKSASKFPSLSIVIYTTSQLTINELQQFKQLKIQFPFLNMYFLCVQKLSFKQNIQLIDAGINLIRNFQEISFENNNNSSDSLHFDGSNLKLIKNGKEISLRKKETELLHFFYLNQGKTLTKETLLSAVWGYKDTVFTRTLESHICALRTKLNDKQGQQAKIIATVHGKGYKFNLPAI
jgi:DNA-binding winged helix-turn-helix (wHTH) protein